MRSSVLIFQVFLLLTAAACYGQKGDRLEPAEFDKRLNTSPESILIDVRTRDEYDQEHIPHAVSIDWNSTSFEVAADTLDRSKPLMVYCYSGHRSAEAAATLRNMGFRKVYELSGGLRNWKEKGKKTE